MASRSDEEGAEGGIVAAAPVVGSAVGETNVAPLSAAACIGVDRKAEAPAERRSSKEREKRQLVSFLEVDSEDVLCSICLEVLASPVALPCGHCFDR